MNEKTSIQFNKYVKEFKNSVIGRSIFGYTFTADHHSWCLNFGKDNDDLVVYCDPFWEYEQTDKLEDLGKIHFELHINGYVEVSDKFNFPKSFNVEEDVALYFQLVENYILNYFEISKKKLINHIQEVEPEALLP